MSTTTSVALKVMLIRSPDNAEIRRLPSHDVAYDALLHLIHGMWSGASDAAPVGESHAKVSRVPSDLVLEYLDEEDDRIRITSQAECDEARVVHRQNLRAPKAFKLFVRRASTRFLPPTTSVESTLASERGGSGPASAAAAAAAGLQLDAASITAPLLELLSALFKLDARQALLDATKGSTEFFEVVGRVVRGSTVYMTLNVPLLTRKIIQTFNDCIEKGMLSEAERGYQLGLGVLKDHPIFEYNAACAASLRGNIDVALKYITNALQHGYRNIANLRHDKDLEAVRKDPRFEALLKGLRCRCHAVEAKVQTLRGILPYISVEEAMAALAVTFGDVEVAVNNILRSA